jgi:hypothetical protein
MARRKYAHIGHVVELGFRYRYSCERCGARTEWFPAKISQKAEMPAKISADIDEELQAEAEERLRQVILKLKGLLQADSYEIVALNEPFVAQEYNDLFAQGRACPSCGCRQSWYPASSSPLDPAASAKNYALVFGAAGLLLALPTHRIAIALNLPRIAFAASLAALAALLGAAVGLGATKLKISSKKRLRERANYRRKPEVDWEG